MRPTARSARTSHGCLRSSAEASWSSRAGRLGDVGQKEEPSTAEGCLLPRLRRQPIGPLVHRIAGMAAHPAPLDLDAPSPPPAAAATDPCSPPDRPPHCASCAAPSPACQRVTPFFTYSLSVCSTTSARPLQRLQRRRRRGQLHAVVGGRRIGAGQFALDAAEAQDRRPAARSRDSACSRRRSRSPPPRSPAVPA